MRGDGKPKIWGPTWIESKGRYRVVVSKATAEYPKGKRSTRWFDDVDDAKDYREVVEGQTARFSTTKVSEAIDLYEQHLMDKGTIGYGETIRRLKAFFPNLEMAVSRVTPDRAKAYYETFRKRRRPDGEPISVDYHRAALINARSFCKWCIDQGWLALNPFAAVEGIGRRSAGKAQLTGDELLRLYSHCFARAEAGDASALGVLMVFLMALRSGDLCRRVVRDVDMGGTVLRVTGGKTAASNRPRAIPAVLRPMMAALIKGRPAGEPLFKTPYTESGHHTRRWLEEAMVKYCAAVDVPYVPPHSLKGASGTLAAELGDTGDRLAAHMSHSSTAITERHYLAPGALDDARMRKALKVVNGGKR